MERLSPTLRTVLTGVVVWLWMLQGCDFQTESTSRPDEGNDSVYVNTLGMQFRRIPAGTFRMGSNEGQKDEQPIHTVEISAPFHLGIYEVTQAQWNILMDENPSHFRGLHRPVDSVSWRRAQRFIRRLNEREDTDLYRLPTEAEWEYAARAGTRTRFYYGNARDSMTSYAWYSFNSERRSHRVGGKRRNPFGLNDIYGNVWEWTLDAYDPHFYERSGRLNPLNRGRPYLTRRVIRGGGWFSVTSDMRSANRAWAWPDARNWQLGFRVVREIPEDEQ